MLAAALVLIGGWIAYENSFSGIFVFDDEPAIAHNDNLRSLWPLTAAMWAPPDTTLSGRPFAALTFAADHALSGGSLQGFHRTNLVIHLLAALALFGVVRRTLIALGDAGSPARPILLAFATALLFVVHPLQTGAVTYIVQRVESLMGLLYLVTLYCAIRALDDRPRPRRLWMAAAVVSCALGMATKEVMVSAPLMVFLWDRQFAPSKGSTRRGFYLTLAATWILLGALVLGGHRSASAGFGFADWPWWRYLMTQAEVIPHYLRLALIPSPLVLDYDWPAATSFSQIAISGLFTLALLLLTGWGVIRRAPASFAGLWFFLILAPTSSVLPIVTEVAAEHRMYLPLAAVLVLVVCGTAALARRVSSKLPASIRVASPIVGAVVVMLAASVLAAQTRARNVDYQDYDRIWADTIAKRPENARARSNYATSLLTRGRFAEAESHLRVAVERRPDSAESQANLGVALSAQGKVVEGIPHLERAVNLKPGFSEAYRNLGESYALDHRLSDALRAYLRALEGLPDDVPLLNRAAWILSTDMDSSQRNGALSKSLAQRAVSLTHEQDPVALDALAASLAELGDFPGASAVIQQALALAHGSGDTDLSRQLAEHASLFAARRPIRER